VVPLHVQDERRQCSMRQNVDQILVHLACDIWAASLPGGPTARAKEERRHHEAKCHHITLHAPLNQK
jgi:hypothetical protein